MVALSIVIPSLGREMALLNTLVDLVAQDFGDWECLVVLQGHVRRQLQDAVVQILGRRGRVFEQSEPNANRARNRGLLEARASVVLFLDDDVRLPNLRFLRSHYEPYTNIRRSGVYGQVRGSDGRVRSHRHPWSRNERYGWLYFPPNFDQPVEVRTGGSGNLSVRRDWALAVGGFDERFEKGAHREETDFCLRLTDRYGPFLFSPEAWLIHLGEPAGGCRSWGTTEGVVPMHHAFGEWYFIFKRRKAPGTTGAELFHYTAAAVRRQLLNKGLRRRPWLLPSAFARMLSAQAQAARAVRSGPRELTWRASSPEAAPLSPG